MQRTLSTLTLAQSSQHSPASSHALFQRPLLGPLLFGSRHYANAKPDKQKGGKRREKVPKSEKKKCSKVYISKEAFKRLPPQTVVFETPPPPQDDTPKISVSALKQLLDEDPSKVIVIDLRQHKLGEPSIPGSKFLPVPQLEWGKPQEFLGQYLQLPEGQFAEQYQFRKITPDNTQGKQIVFVSATNKRSRSAVKTAIELGFQNVTSLKGGIREWNKFLNPIALD